MRFAKSSIWAADRNVALTLRTRIGPAFALASQGTGSATGFQALFGVAYNTR